jgi:tetratricopeptide (TPR) repeat protein
MMKLRFLCANHRGELEQNTSRAIKFWQAGYDTGQFYTDRSQWAEAIPHLGCAFESAEILLSGGSLDTEVSCQWLTSSAVLLALSFKYSNYSYEAEDVIWMAINCLERQLTRNPSQALWVSHYLGQLYYQLKSFLSEDHHSANELLGEINISSLGELMH